MKFAIDRSVSFNMTHFVGKAFVSLEYKHYRDFILHEVNNHSDFLVLEGRSLRISKACCPNDIFWANLSIDRWTRLKSVIFSYLILLMLLTFAFAAVLLIQIIK